MILFIGEYWQGSSARSMCEALVRQGAQVEELHQTMFFPQWRMRGLRASLRFLNYFIRKDFENAVLEKLKQSQKAIVIVYKGYGVSAELIKKIRKTGNITVNVFPDYTPIGYGIALKKALAEYDLIVSTKCWHPEAWRSMFGYSNKCVFIPHGYDPLLHSQEISDQEQPIDILLIATFRQQYGDIMRGLLKEKDLHSLKFHIEGPGWQKLKLQIPSAWRIGEGVHGQMYRKMISQAKICIAPVHRDVVINGKQYPGDEDTIRTYELPAMGAFAIHRRTSYVQKLFNEKDEMLMFDDPSELAEHIRFAMNHPHRRLEMRQAAQARCRERDSIDKRAAGLLEILRKMTP